MTEEALFESLCELDRHRMELEITKEMLILRRERYLANLKMMKRMNTTKCPHCAQTIDKGEIMSQITRLNEKILTYDDPIRLAKYDVKEATDEWRKVRRSSATRKSEEAE